MKNKSQKVGLVTYGSLIKPQNLKIGKVVLIEGVKRLWDPNVAWFPFAMLSKRSKVYGLYYEIDADQLEATDRYEGVPSLYTREQVKIRFSFFKRSKAFIYIPSVKTQERSVSRIEDPNDGWINHWIKPLIQKYPMFTKMLEKLSINLRN